jgi:hypothetical protein
MLVILEVDSIYNQSFEKIKEFLMHNYAHFKNRLEKEEATKIRKNSTNNLNWENKKTKDYLDFLTMKDSKIKIKRINDFNEVQQNLYFIKWFFNKNSQKIPTSKSN